MEGQEQAAGVFAGTTFYVDSDVNEQVIEGIRQERGVIVSELPAEPRNPNNLLWIVNQDCRNKAASGCRVVFQNWVNMCLLRGKQVDPAPFSVTPSPSAILAPPPPPASEQPKKRTKGERYTAEEDETLWSFAASHAEQKLKQEELWNLAQEEGLLEGRTAVSMLKRYRQLKSERNVHDKHNKHYTESDDLNILRWAWLWQNRDRTGALAHFSIWEAAAQHHIVWGRGGSQLSARFSRLVAKHKGMEQTMTEAARVECFDEDKWTLFVAKENIM
jgi:hypothetical protein